MPKRVLAHLKNLGNWALENTKKTILAKARKLGKSKKNKENEPPVPSEDNHNDFASAKVPNMDASRTRVASPDMMPREEPDVTACDVDIEDLDWDDGGIPGLPGSGDTPAAFGENDTIFTEAADVHGVEPDVGDHSDSESDSDDEEVPGPHQTRRRGKAWEERKPPTEAQAIEAIREVQAILRPPSGGKRHGYKTPKINAWTRRHLEEIHTMLNLYTGAQSKSKGAWMPSADQAVQGHGKKPEHARKLRECTRKFVIHREIPVNPYGKWTKSKIDTDDELAQDIELYLQSIGKYVSAHDIVIYLDRPDVKAKYGIKNTVSETTAKRWMEKMGYRWVKNHKGWYVDGHEHDDVVNYRQTVFLPTWYSIEGRMRSWTTDNVEEFIERLPNGTRRIVAWFHDESIFYAHDRRTAQWVKEDSSPQPYTKGEGPSLMVADFVSADYGFLRSLDGKESARVIFKPGKNRDGYFDHQDILKQVEASMKILTRDYPEVDHIFIYDNAPTHLKRAEDAISARRMPKNIPKAGTNWGVAVSVRDGNGKLVYGPDGKVAKVKVEMAKGTFADGSPQDFYFRGPNPRAGVFKGMAEILKERGYGDMSQVRAECVKFKCPPDAHQCCCRRILYNEPDFANASSLLETFCISRGFKIIFLPKFHCELNFIEQVWGRAKRTYRLNPPSSKEDDLERNMLAALDSIELFEMRRFARRARRFMDAYNKGLTGKQAAWAGKKYHGHRVLPESLMNDLEKGGMS